MLAASTRAFLLTMYMQAFRDFIVRVLTVVPQNTP